jgi:hypothetical protein
MLQRFYRCDGCGGQHARLFKSPYLPSVAEDSEFEVYWLAEWGVNPYEAAESEGRDFNPEWN